MCDDGVGPFVVASLHDQLLPQENLQLVNGSTVPELYWDEIAAFYPDHVIIVDAAEMQAAPGIVEIVEKDHMQTCLPLSSHALPITVTVDWIATAVPNTDIFLLGIQPEIVTLAEETLEIMGNDDLFFEEVESDPLKPFFRFRLTPLVESAALNIVKTLRMILESHSP